MTAQVADSVELDGQRYAIAGVQGGPLFDPGAHRVKPAAISSACWRGYICCYEIIDDTMRLARLVIGSQSRIGGDQVSVSSTLLGRKVVAGPSWLGGWQVSGLDVPVPITGGLLLGQGFIRSTYVHMGFHPAWKFETVIELIFQDGTVTHSRDRSTDLAALRQRIESGEVPDPDGPRGGARWVERVFALDYRRSLPDSD